MSLPDTATDIATAVRSQSVSAVSVVEDCLDRISNLNETLNCFTRRLDELALAHAKQLDAQIARGEPVGPLAGVPLGVKDLFDVAGLTTTAGSTIFQDRPAAQTAPAVQQLQDAGAILVGTLNMDEFAYGFSTENSHFGTTRNPQDTERLAGGSSGGSAAAVAAGLVPLSLGSDTNGSIRVPASLTGLFGLRPTHDGLPMEGVFPFVDRLDTIGPFTRTLADLRVAYDAMHGPVAAPDRGSAPRVGLLGGWFAKGGSQDAINAARHIFDALGGNEQVDLELAELGRSAAFLITAYEGGHLHLDNLRSRPMEFDPATRDRLIAGAMLPEAVMADAERGFALAAEEIHDTLARVDVLIAPATPSTAPKISEGLIAIDGKMVSARANLGLYTQPVSIAGVPILTVPLKRPGQLPLGVQLIAGRGREALLFDLAERLVADGVIGFVPPPNYAGAL